MSAVERVGVVGAGLMGSGIAEVCARAGSDVIVAEADDASARAGERRLGTSLARAVDRGKLSSTDRDTALSRLTFTTNLDDFADRQLVIEAVVEREDVKTDVLTRLDAVLGANDAVLATNTSSLPIMRLATATRHPERVIGLHFFNPVPVMPIVEVVGSLLTGNKTRAKAENYVTEVLGKNVIHARDRAGFIVNALLVPYLLSAIRMFEAGFASAADIDEGMRKGCAHPMGPLELTDLIGLDTTQLIAESMYDEFKEPLYAPPPLLQRMTDAGLLGKKSGRGFYDYSS